MQAEDYTSYSNVVHLFYIRGNMILKEKLVLISIYEIKFISFEIVMKKIH